MINKLIASSVSVFPKWFIELFSKSYVAGYSSNEVLSIVEKLNGQGFSATIDILGEHVKDLDISKNITQQYCELFENINLTNISWIASHPIAGTEESGPSAGFKDLFKNRWTIICDSNNLNKDKVEKLKKFWEFLGSKVKLMSTDDHDYILALTSHLIYDL